MRVASQAGANDLLEGGSRNHFIAMPGKKVFVARVADDELVFGIVERESLGDRLDRFGEAKPGFSNFLQVGFFHRDRGVAKHSQRLPHASDLVVTPRRERGPQIAGRERKGAIAQFAQARDQIAPDIEPHDQRRADKAQDDGDDHGKRAEINDRQCGRIRVINFLARAGYETVDGGGQVFREVGILTEKLRGILRERKLQPAQLRHAA
jgi:hypothetical protein